MRTSKVDANYWKLEPDQRFVLFAHALRRNDQPELERLIRTAPLDFKVVPDYNGLAQAFDHVAHVYVESQLNLIARLFLFSLLPGHDHAQDARVQACAFLHQHQAWLDFCRWLDVPPELAFNYWPPSKSTLRAAEEWARHVASSDKPRRDELAGITTSKEILSLLQQEFDAWAGRATKPPASAARRGHSIVAPPSPPRPGNKEI